MTPRDKFWAKVDTGGDCWAWKGYRNPKGYGTHYYEGRMTLAHRLAWTLTNGPIPDRLFACHTCDNPACVNPAHLFLGTGKDNVRDCLAKGRLKPPRGSAHRDAKLTEDAVRVIRLLFEEGASAAGLAASFGVPKGLIWDVVGEQTWRHVA